MLLAERKGVSLAGVSSLVTFGLSGDDLASAEEALERRVNPVADSESPKPLVSAPVGSYKFSSFGYEA